jgi:hypothetical protein
MPGTCQPVLSCLGLHRGKVSRTMAGQWVPLDGELARRREFDRADGLPHTAQLQATGGPRSASSISVPPEREKLQEPMRNRER